MIKDKLYKHKIESHYICVIKGVAYLLSNDNNWRGSDPIEVNSMTNPTILKEIIKEYNRIKKVTKTKYSWYYGNEYEFWESYKFNYPKKDYFLIDINSTFKKIKFV